MLAVVDFVVATVALILIMVVDVGVAAANRVANRCVRCVDSEVVCCCDRREEGVCIQ